MWVINPVVGAITFCQACSYLATLKRAATIFAAWWTEARWVTQLSYQATPVGEQITVMSMLVSVHVSVCQWAYLSSANFFVHDTYYNHRCWRYWDSVDNTVEISSIFSVTHMRWLPSARGHVGSKTFHQQNPWVAANAGWPVYNGRWTVVVADVEEIWLSIDPFLEVLGCTMHCWFSGCRHVCI